MNSDVGDADHLELTPQQMLSDRFIAERRSHLDERKSPAIIRLRRGSAAGSDPRKGGEAVGW